MFRALIVEDEEIVRKGLILTTDWNKYDVEIIGEAKNGKEGLDLALKLKPDIIITDIKMPIMDGLEMIKILSETQDLSFIVISAFSEFEYAKKALKLGAIDYLLKPFTDLEFEKAINKAKDNVKDLSDVKKYSSDNRDDYYSNLNRYLSLADRSTHQNAQATREYISDNYNKDISLSSLADYLKVSESTISRMFRSEFNYGFSEYLTLYRLREACKLLEDPNVKIYEVALAVGYNDQRYFSSVFKKYLGVSPNHFKERF